MRAAADTTLRIKYIIKMTAARHKKTVTFMTKPLYNEAGSGMHFHQHLFCGGAPLFFDEAGYGGLSELARQYVAGILVHADALVGHENAVPGGRKQYGTGVHPQQGEGKREESGASAGRLRQ
jgi:glutamine synthetase